MKTLNLISAIALSVLIISSCAYQKPERYSPKPNLDQFPPLGIGRTWVFAGDGNGSVTIEFDENYNAHGQSYCNSYSSRVTMLDNGEIKFGAIMSTKRNCELIELESEYFDLLSMVDSYEVTGNQLILNWSTGGERGRLVFYPQKISMRG